MSLRPWESPSGPAFEAFLRAHHPLSLRLRGALAESGGSIPLWVDDPAGPRLAVHAARGTLFPLGETALLLARLDELDALSAQLGAEEDLLRLASLPLPQRDAVAAARRLIRQTACGFYTLRAEDFRPFEGGPPVESLREEDAPLLAQLGEYGESEEYCRERIRGAPSAAVRIGGEPASYMVVHANGSIGMLRTLEAHRSRGLARSVVTALVRRQLARGREVYCYIVDGNAPSERVFLSLGFERAADAVWATFERGRAAGG
ncbi:MAG: GNAT family N-acetyltransferase [Nitrospinota bacterium]